MDLADLYLQHNHFAVGRKPAPTAAAGAPTMAVGQAIHELVGGTLSAQEYTDRLEALEQRVGSFEEKLMNLTRLIKLSQGLQAEKEVELQKDNDELRARIQRQEHLTAQLMREVGAVKQQSESKALADAVATLDKSAKAAAEAAQDAARRLDRLEHEQRDTGRSLAAGLDETRVWARRNLQRLKEHVDALSSGVEEVRGGHGELSSRVESLDCRAEAEYKKLRVLLHQKATEADTMAALIEKELVNVRQVAQRHEVLATPEANPPPVDVDALKFKR